MWTQKEITLKAKSRGFHLATKEIVSQLAEIERYEIGILHLFIKHTSASLSINENADPSVRDDLEQFFKRNAPDGDIHYTHTDEGPDDITAHIKNVMIGSELSIPISEGQLNLGLWQGIYLCEHRSDAHQRVIVATINGQEKQ